MLGSRPVPLNTEGSSNQAYARTPAKGLLKNRLALQENAIYFGSMTGNGKGKANLLQTPFHPSTHSRKGMQTEKPTVLFHQPLGNKTPFPNRQLPMQTPAPQGAKFAKFSELDPALAKTPGALLLPSAKRKSLRLPRSASKKFTTPAQQGNHWDVSDGELDADISRSSVEVQDVPEEDYDEIEYMPPKLPEQPYEPLFELPNYKEAGRTLLSIAHSDLYDDTMDLYYAADIDLQIDMKEVLKDSGAFDVDILPLSELASNDDDLLFPALNTIVPPSTPILPPLQKTAAKLHAIHTELPARSSRPMTRAASKALAESRAPTPTTLVHRPPSATAIRASSRNAANGFAGRATPSSDHSTAASRPGTSNGIRAPVANASRQPSSTRERMATRSATHSKAGQIARSTKPSYDGSARSMEDLDLLPADQAGLDISDDFLFDI